MNNPGADASRFHSYRACGLWVASEVELQSLIPAEPKPEGADIVISRGEVPAELAGETLNRGPNWQHTKAAFLLRLPGIARFLIEDARRIVFATEDGKDDADITAFLTGSVMGLLLHLRGRVVLHASAVLVGGKAVLFCGNSGAGKSTMAAALSKRGYTMLSDDICVLEQTRNGPPIVYSDGRKHKLWQGAIDRLDLAGMQGQEVRRKLSKFFVEPGATHTEGAPLAALYELYEELVTGEISLEPTALADAATVVLRNAFRPRIVWHLGQKAEYFRASAGIARWGSVHILRRPLDFRHMATAIDRLEAHWRDIGLLEAG